LTKAQEAYDKAQEALEKLRAILEGEEEETEEGEEEEETEEEEGEEEEASEPVDDGRGLIPALTAVRTAFLYAEENPEWKILVTGHCDTRGRARYNFELSSYRAKAILSLLMADDELWAEAVEAKNLVEDRQAVLKHFHGYEGLNCDPGEIDGVAGSQTRRATMDFQAGYNRLFSEDISVDGRWGPQTWEAVFNVYLRKLARSLDTDRAHLYERARGLNFFPGRQMCCCGESIPKDHPGADSYNSQTNRRVEILFISPSTDIEFTCCTADGPFPEEVCDPNSCPLYGNVEDSDEAINQFENITEEETVETANIKIILKDAFGKPISDMGYTLKHLSGQRTGQTDSEGLILEESVPQGEVRIVPDDGSLITFAEEADEDYDGSDTFGDEETPPGGGISSSSTDRSDRSVDIEEEELLQG
jgi:hypothetical protein